MTEPSKAVRRRLRELIGLAHARELSQHLEFLLQSFQSWKRGELSPFELRDKIHEFHQKPSRDLFVLYRDWNRELAVARAVVLGLLSKEEVGESLLLQLEDRISTYRGLQENE